MSSARSSPSLTDRCPFRTVVWIAMLTRSLSQPQSRQSRSMTCTAKARVIAQTRVLLTSLRARPLQGFPKPEEHKSQPKCSARAKAPCTLAILTRRPSQLNRLRKHGEALTVVDSENLTDVARQHESPSSTSQAPMCLESVDVSLSYTLQS